MRRPPHDQNRTDRDYVLVPISYPSGEDLKRLEEAIERVGQCPEELSSASGESYSQCLREKGHVDNLHYFGE